MSEPVRPRWSLGVVVLSLAAAGVLPGCAVVPRDRIEESRRVVQSLRTENARLKDEVVSLKTQNRDYSDRAVDDLRRLTARDEAIGRLEQSVQAYQDDRDRLAAAYRRLALSLGRSSEDSAVESTAASSDEASVPTRPVHGDLRPIREAETLTREEDGDARATRSRPPADGSDP